MNARRRFLFSLAVFCVLSLAAVQACGPDFAPDTFVRVSMPDNLQTYAEGHLGILQTGYDSNEYAVAFRYLNGSALSPFERAIYAPPPTPFRDWSKVPPAEVAAARKAEADKQPVNQWRNARARFVPAGTANPLPADYAQFDDWFNPDSRRCPDDAFVTAALTLNHRAQAWGAKSPWLLNWISGQDAVFANCAGKTATQPQPAPASAPALLHEDRAYQSAAADFYAGQLDQARSGFEAIAHNPASPWSSIAPYLVARSLVRKAFADAPKTDPYSGDLATFDKPTMLDAQHLLESLLKQANPSPSRHAVQAELNFVRMRTEPEARIAEVCAALTGPAPDPNFGWDLDDLSYALMKQIPLKDPPPLLAWIHAVRDPAATSSTIATWRSTHTLPWLVLALMKVDAANPAVPDLLAAAAAIPTSSPAYDTVFFHRVRLLTALHRDNEARALLDERMPALRAASPSSATNAYLGERMAVARSFDEFLTYAPRTLLETQSAGAAQITWNCRNSDGTPASDLCGLGNNMLEFADDAALVLNRQTPLALLVKATNSTRLPTNLRRDLVLAAWTRSVVLGDEQSARALAPHLPPALRKVAGNSIGFPAVFAILHNPGLRPYVEPGVSRLVSYNRFDNFRNNWWCAGGYGQFSSDPWSTIQPAPPAYFTPEQRAAAHSEFTRLMQMPCAPVFMGRVVVDYAASHPSDPRLPEALALTVRATHYACLDWGLTREQPDTREADWKTAEQENTAVSRAAFTLLHKRYPNSPWTAKTRYYY